MNGRITVYTGPMGSGKSGRLVDAIEAERAKRGFHSVAVFCPGADTRSMGTIKARGRAPVDAVVVEQAWNLLHRQEPVIAIDEAHMLERVLGKGVLASWALFAASQGQHVYVSTIDIDANGEACAPIPMLRQLSRLPGIEEIFEWYQLRADCSDCKDVGPYHGKGMATYSWMVPDLPRPIPGDLGTEYLALCGGHFWQRHQERWHPTMRGGVAQPEEPAPYTDAHLYEAIKVGGSA